MIKSLYNQIGQSIQTARKEKGLTQADLARLTDVSRPSIVNIEKGRQTISVHALFNIATALGISFSALVPPAAAVFPQDFQLPDSVKNSLTHDEQKIFTTKLMSLMK